MPTNPKFGPAAQTPEQRAWVLEQMQRIIPSLRNHVPPYVQQLFGRYIAGEISWSEVYQARQLASTTN
jgi:hypothetical protein